MDCPSCGRQMEGRVDDDGDEYFYCDRCEITV